MLYDLLLKGGTLVDPAQQLHAVLDVAFADGKVGRGRGRPARGPGAPNARCRGLLGDPRPH